MRKLINPCQSLSQLFSQSPRRITTGLLSLILILLSTSSFAIDTFIISDIKVKGLQKLEQGTIFNYLPLKVGDQLDEEEASLGIKALFKTGFFEDVQFENEGTELIVIVVERPSINSITILGNKAIETEQIEVGLEAASLVEGRILSPVQLERFEREMQNAYLAIGRYSAKIEASSKKIENNRVDIEINIDEGRVATIKKINIIGAEDFSANKLLSRFKLASKKGLNPFSKKNQYSKQKLEADIESLRSFYLDNGYYDFKVTASSVDISPNKQSIFVSVSISEGEQFIFGETSVEGGDAVPQDELTDLITIERDQPFSRKTVNQTRAAISDSYADAGYAFADVTPLLQPDRVNQVVNVVFTVKQNERVYVRRINVRGNTYTRDDVIRRELRQFEGGWYSATAIRLSRERLQRLGFFQAVSIDTAAVAGKTDQIDLTVVVNESDTGSIQFTLGFSDADGALFGIQYEQRNLAGSGKKLVLDINRTGVSNTAVIEYTNPYHTENGVSRSFNATVREIDAEEANTASYLVDTASVGVNYRIPIAETNSLTYGLAFEQIQLFATDQTPPEILVDILKQPEGDNLVFNFGVSKDTSDDFFFPTKGAKGSVSIETTAPGSDFEYYKLNLSGTLFLPVGRNLTFKSRGLLGYGDGFGDNAGEGLPFFKNYFAGGARTVRGYKARSLGPRDSSSDPKTLGGNKRVVAGLELLLPPLGDGDNRDKQFGLFIDAGMVFGNDETVDLAALRTSAGIVFNWFSPLGPFAMSYAIPLNEEDGDEIEEFQISLGTLF